MSSKSFANLRHFAHTAKDVVTTVITTGKLYASPDLVKKRREICASCPYLISSRCSKCGCFIHSKSSLEAANCPEKRW